MNKLIFTLLLFGLQPALGASFNCGKAHSQMEKLICSDEKLSKADEELNTVYKQAIGISKAKPTMVQWQREWLKSYDVTSCQDANCLMALFASRIELLKNVAPKNNSSAAWNGNYVRFVNGKQDLNSAALLLIGLSNNRVYLSGSSLWQGPNAANSQVHTGEIAGIGTTTQEKLSFNLDGCKGELQLTKKGLIVTNESGCGGMNVSFNGEYRKK
jgi:uncharacterized protein